MTTHTRIDPAEVRETHQQIRSIVAELAEIAHSDIERAEFYRETLTRLVSALAAQAGAVWIYNDKGELALQFQINLQQIDLPRCGAEHEGHVRLLSKALQSDEGLVVPPHSGSADEGEAANPTSSLLILAPLASHERRYGVIEIFQRPVGGAAMHRGFLRFVMEACGLASDYLNRCELQQYADRQALWNQLEDFCRAVHSGLSVRQVALVVANEGRRLIGCDRLSVATMRGRHPRLSAISGQETFDRRSAVVRRLGRLIQATVAGREPMWYHGDASLLPPQLEKCVHDYIDAAEHVKSIGVVPLVTGGKKANAGGTSRRRRAELVGVLVVEQFQQAQLSEAMQERLRVVQEHAALALMNAQEHEGLFLMPLWRALGRCRAVAARSLSLLAIVACLAGLGAAMALVPADFEIESRGTLQPVVRREIFIREPGVVAGVLVDHAQAVKQGADLLELRNRDLEVSITDLVGRRTATEEQVAALRRARNDSRLNFEEQNRLAGQIKQLEKTLDSLSRQLELLTQKQKALTIKSPIDGQVVTWDVKNLLQERPVEKGQIAMTVADTAGPWELELHIRERRAGYVARAWQQAQGDKKPLEVEYILATGPGRRLTGTVKHLDTIAEVRGDEGNTVLATVAIDRNEIDPAELRPGAGVTAKVHCGRRMLGFVWFHELIDTVRAKVLFWL